MTTNSRDHRVALRAQRPGRPSGGGGIPSFVGKALNVALKLAPGPIGPVARLLGGLFS